MRELSDSQPATPAARREARPAELLLSVSSRLAMSKTLTEALDTLVEITTATIGAERGSIFLNDTQTGELYTRVAEGKFSREIRMLNSVGVAGHVFTTGKGIVLHDAYADLRFNPSFDRQAGFFTRSILCVPVINKDGKAIGATQVLNKKGGPFTDEDEARVRAFTSQIAIGLENATLFEDVQNMKNYNESMLESMSNGVVTVNEDGAILTCNAAGLRIMKVDETEILLKPASEFFVDANAWVAEKLEQVVETQPQDVFMDTEMEFGGEKVSANVTIMPLVSTKGEKLGSMIMIEDISTAKRMKSTMSRERKWAAAREAFGEALDLQPDDKLSKLYIDRCLHLEEEPPAADWDGVWVMKSK